MSLRGSAELENKLLGYMKPAAALEEDFWHSRGQYQRGDDLFHLSLGTTIPNNSEDCGAEKLRDISKAVAACFEKEKIMVKGVRLAQNGAKPGDENMAVVITIPFDYRSEAINATLMIGEAADRHREALASEELASAVEGSIKAMDWKKFIGLSAGASAAKGRNVP